MAFLTGPRQVGKTTLAKSLIPHPLEGVNYFNWDHAAHRRTLTGQIFAGRVDLGGEHREIIVFDEIHKYTRWKNALKGLFDFHEPDAHWIVTGSAALNIHRKGQDSLMGRSFTYHLAPFSVAELAETFVGKEASIDDILRGKPPRPDANVQESLDLLLTFSGFPEPFLKGSEAFLRRWRTTRLDRLINQDLASTETLKHLPLVEQLMHLLPERVGNPLSLNSLREDLEVHFATAKHWMELLERVFYGFMVRPFGGRSSRALKKEPKWYLWDWTEIDDAGFRFENLVAVHFLKFVHFINDLGLDELSLHYLRDKEKREVDFLICRKKKPLLLAECKLGETAPSKALAHFARLFRPERAIQLVAAPIDPATAHRAGERIDILPAASFLRGLV